MPVKPLADLSRTLRGLIVANIVVSAGALLAALYRYAEYSALPEGPQDPDLYLTADVVTFAVAMLQFGLLLAVGIVFLVWVHRANKNLRALSGEVLRFTPGWSVGWFFIPIFSLFRPYQVVKEIWLVSHRRRDPLLLGQAVSGEGAGLVGLWWFFFLLSKVVGQVAARLGIGAVDVAGSLTSAVGDAVASGIDVVGYAVTLMLVVRITAAYAANIDERQALMPAAGAWGTGATTPAAGAWGAGGAAPAAGAWGAGGTGHAVAAPALGASWPAAGGAPFPGAAPRSELPPAAWHPDPTGRHQLRWWDGAEWTEYVGDLGAMSEDPI